MHGRSGSRRDNTNVIGSSSDAASTFHGEQIVYPCILLTGGDDLCAQI